MKQFIEAELNIVLLGNGNIIVTSGGPFLTSLTNAALSTSIGFETPDALERISTAGFE